MNAQMLLHKVPGARRRASRLVRNSGPFRALYGAVGGEVVTIIGDSHATVMKHVARERMLRRTQLIVVPVPGATAFGLANPNTTTNAINIFKAAVKRMPVGGRLVIFLGEVDAGFLVFHRATRNGTDPRQEAADSLQRYYAFVRDEVLSRGLHVTLVSVSPPVVEDYETWVGLQGQRRGISASWTARAEVTDWYNDRLAEFATEEGLGWIDLRPDLTGPDGRIKGQFLRADSADHHLNDAPLGRLLARRLSEQARTPAGVPGKARV